MNYSQYAIIIVNLDPTVGSEIKKTRPCIIISPNEMNNNLRTIVIAPLTSTLKNYPTRVRLKFQNRESSIVLDQIQTIDKQRIIKTAGRIKEVEIEKVKSIIKETYVE